MNILPPSNNTPSIPLAYPGITIESIPWTQNIYEVVWNCGSLSALMMTLSDERVRQSSFTLLASMLEDIRKIHPRIIFITDINIFKENSLIEILFREIFGAGNYKFIFTQKSQPEKNQLSGLRVNRSEFISISDANSILRDFSDAPVVSSIPYSDPRIDTLMDEYISHGWKKDTLSIQSLKLLQLNSKKSNQIQVANEAIWFLWKADDSESLKEILFNNPNTPLVLKEDESAAWWTTVNFVFWEDQRKKVIAERHNFPILVYRFFAPTLLENTQGQNFPIQLRPYFTVTWRFAGGCLKFPQRPMRSQTWFIEWSGKRAFQDQNESLNTSSGLTQSFFFDDAGRWITWFRSIGEVLDATDVTRLLQDFTVKWVRLTPELLKKWALWVQPVARDIQIRTCSLLWVINNK